MAEDYTAQFKMLAGRTGFNDEALKDACPGLSPLDPLKRFLHRPPFPKVYMGGRQSFGTLTGFIEDSWD